MQRRTIVGAVFFAGLCLVVVALWRWRLTPSPPSNRPPNSTAFRIPTPGLTVEGVEGLVFQQEGRKTWELFADRITLDKAQTQAVAQNIRKAIYYGADGRPLFWLSAPTLRYDATQGVVTVEGSIYVQAQLPRGQGLRATADTAVWRESTRSLDAQRVQGQAADTQFLIQQVRYLPDRSLLIGSGGVTVIRPTLQVTCASVQADLAHRYYLAEPPVRVTLFAGLAPVTIRPVAQQPPSPKAPTEPKRQRMHLETNKPVILKGDELVAQDVVITEEGEDYKATAPRAVYNRETEQVQVEGGVRFEDPETVATAPRAQIDTRRRIAVFFGPVEVIVKPRKTAEPDKAGKNSTPSTGQKETEPKEEKEGATADASQKEGAKPQKQRESFRERLRQRGGRLICDRAEYYYRERRVVATGNVQFEQEGRYKGRSDKLIYLTRDDILTLEGNIVVDELKKGHRFQCPRAVINLETDEAQFDPPVKVDFIVTEEEEEKGKTKGQETPPQKAQEPQPQGKQP